MTTPLFPSVEQVVDLILSELPEGVYAIDRADDPDYEKRSYSSSEVRAHAQLLADLYGNLDGIWRDKFITTVTHDGLAPWEKELFSSSQDSSLPDSTRQAKLLAKFRASGGISYPAIRDVVAGLLTPLGLAFDLGTACGGDGLWGWVLDLTELDVGTYLAPFDPLMGARRDLTPLDCSLDYAAAGLTHQDLLDIQATAYTYQVRIYGHADADTLAILDDLLTRFEPARSTHEVLNDAVVIDADGIDMGLFTGDTLQDVIDGGTFTGPAPTFNVWDMGAF